MPERELPQSTESQEDADATAQEAIRETALQEQAPAAGGRQISDTLGTGSGCAIGCTMLAIAIIAVGILVLIITR